MGPRFCKRGNNEDLAMGVKLNPASMGPRFCKRGNYWSRHSSDDADALQWGHAFVSVETPKALNALANGVEASMGPRFCKRGNTAHQGQACMDMLSFNGATLL